MNCIKQTSNLSQIYPGVSQQLCNKHTKLLSKLKTTFTEVYDELQPEQYVIINGIAKILDMGNDMQINFALENGITILLRKTYKNQDIYINGNHVQEELIFNSKGKHIEGINERINQIKQIVQLIRGRSDNGKEFYGGILYIHSNIGESLFGFQECFMLGIVVALLMIHEELEKYNRSDILTILQKASPTLSMRTISNLMSKYEIGKCTIEYNNKISFESENELQININDPNSDKSISTHQSNESIKSTHERYMKNKDIAATKSNNSISSLDQYNQLYKEEISLVKVNIAETSKLILCKLDLSKEQEERYHYKLNRIRYISDSIQQERYSKNDIFDQNQNRRQSPSKESIKQDETHLIKYCQENRLLMNKLINATIQFTQYIHERHQLDIKYAILEDEVVEIIRQINKQASFVKNFCIIQGSVLLISMDKQYYAQVMCYLRRLLNDFKLSTYKYLQTKHKLDQQKYNQEIGEIMFTTMPSLGCAIYTPNEDIWI